MKTKTLMALAFAVVAVPVTVLGAVGTWTPWGRITTITDYGQGAGITGLTLTANPARCTSTGIAWVKYSMTDEQRRKLSQSVHEAFLSGRDIQVKLDPVECVDNAPSYYGVAIK